jgi:farnesyl-diphosphate farnesyltransferase
VSATTTPVAGAAAAATRDADRAYCRAMLPRVSRTFALCIRLLPPALEHPVLVAYLLCRIADTVEDSGALDAATKVHLLRAFRDALDEPVDADPDGRVAALRATFDEPASDDERLARSAETALREFARLPAAERAIVRPWVQEMCDGMAEFARLGAGGGVHALDSVAALERYCYYVAGTVGHLLTGLFLHHAPGVAPARRAELERLATSFGLGLQLTNIVKDVHDDRSRGWSFVPRDLCDGAGVAPEQLLDAAHRAAALRVLRALVEKARAHLDDAIRYCTLLPRRPVGMRAFCLTSVYFAIRTLALAERDPRLLEPGHKLKITRGAVYRSLLMTYLVAPSDVLVRWYYRRLGGRPGPGAARG